MGNGSKHGPEYRKYSRAANQNQKVGFEMADQENSARQALAVEPKPQPRHYYRCVDCLSVAAADQETKYYDPAVNRFAYGFCGACGGRLEYMGHVHRERIYQTQYVCPCDARCTNAPGPNCSCRCGGKNHGSNLVVAVEVDAGGIPTLRIDPKAAAKGKAYRELLAAVDAAIEARFGRVIHAKRMGEYLTGGEYSQYCNGTWLIRKKYEAMALRSHAGRNKRLQAIIADCQTVKTFAI